MITYEGELKVTREEFYNTLLGSMVEDINGKFKKELTISDLESGYKYTVKTTRGKKETRATIRITTPRKGYSVATNYYSEGVSYNMQYDIEDLQDHIKVIYKQENGNNKEGFLNRQLVKKNIKSRFKEFEKYIIKQRKKCKENQD